MNAISAANADGSDASSRQASMMGSGSAAASMTRIRQPASARSRQGSGSVWSRPAAPGSARNPHASGSTAPPWTWATRPATVMTTQRHRGPGGVIVVREPGMHVVVTGHDPVQHAGAVRLHRQPRRPLRRRAQTVVPPSGGVRQPVLHELPSGALESCARQTSSPGLDVGVAQYLRDLPRRAHMRVHDPVDERRGLGVGRKGLEDVGQVGTVGHGEAHTGDSAVKSIRLQRTRSTEVLIG